MLIGRYLHKKMAIQYKKLMKMKLMGNNSGNTNTTFIIKDVAAAVDTFIRVEAINASGVFAAGDAYARTIGGQLAQIEFEYGNRNKLDTPLKEIHLASP